MASHHPLKHRLGFHPSELKGTDFCSRTLTHQRCCGVDNKNLARLIRVEDVSATIDCTNRLVSSYLASPKGIFVAFEVRLLRKC